MDNAQGTPVALLQVELRSEDGLDQFLGIRAHGTGPVDNPGRRPLQVLAVGGRDMPGLGDIFALAQARWWLATRCPLWNISTSKLVILASTSWRTNAWGTL